MRGSARTKVRLAPRRAQGTHQIPARCLCLTCEVKDSRCHALTLVCLGNGGLQSRGIDEAECFINTSCYHYALRVAPRRVKDKPASGRPPLSALPLTRANFRDLNANVNCRTMLLEMSSCLSLFAPTQRFLIDNGAYSTYHEAQFAALDKLFARKSA